MQAEHALVRTGSVRRSAVAHSAAFAAIFIVLNLHTLRHLHPAFYAVIGMALVTLQLVLLQGSWLRWRRLSLAFALFLLCSVLAGLHSILRMGPVYGLEGFVRFNFTILLAAGAYGYVTNWRIARRLLITYVLIVCIAFLSLPYQFLFGPVSWFADASTRGEFDRFSTLLGNLNAVGAVLGGVLVLSLMLRLGRGLKIFTLACCVIAAVFSMQKAAMASVALAVVWWLLSKYRRHRVRRAIQLVAAVGGLYLLIQIEGVFVERPGIATRIDAMLSTAGINVFGFEPEGYVTRTVSQSLYTRLVSAPGYTVSELRSAYGGLGLVVGLGYETGGTSLTSYPKAEGFPHNGYFLIFGVGGIVMLALFLALAFQVIRAIRHGRRLCRRYSLQDRLELFTVLQAFVGIYLLTMTFSTGHLFQPNLSSLFWATVGILMRYRKDPLVFLEAGAVAPAASGRPAGEAGPR